MNYLCEYQYYENDTPKRLRNMEIKSELNPYELAMVMDCLSDCSIIESDFSFNPGADKINVTNDDTFYRRMEDEYLEFYHDATICTSIFTVRKTGENNGKTIEQLIAEACKKGDY